MEEMMAFMTEYKDSSAWLPLAWIAGKFLDYKMKSQEKITKKLEPRIKELEKQKNEIYDKYQDLHDVLTNWINKEDGE